MVGGAGGAAGAKGAPAFPQPPQFCFCLSASLSGITRDLTRTVMVGGAGGAAGAKGAPAFPQPPQSCFCLSVSDCLSKGRRAQPPQTLHSPCMAAALSGPMPAAVLACAKAPSARPRADRCPQPSCPVHALKGRVLLISPARGLERSNARKLVCRCGEIFNLQETARDSPDYFDMRMIE